MGIRHLKEAVLHLNKALEGDARNCRSKANVSGIEADLQAKYGIRHGVTRQ